MGWHKPVTVLIVAQDIAFEDLEEQTVNG